jgi:molybdopterin-synthase adenylyltransferase
MSFFVKPESEILETAFDRQERLGWWRQSVLREARVMVVGAGALGNEALKNLALLGAGRLAVVDFDVISLSNLSRTVLFRPEDVGRPKAALAAERTRALALEASSVVISLDADLVWDIGLGVYRRMDVILGCLDNDEARLSVNRAARSVGVPWINAGIFELSGSVTSYAGDGGACFECTTTPDQIADAQSRYDSCEMVRKRYLEAERLPTVQVTSALISALQIQEAVKILHHEPVDFGVRLAYNGLTHGFHRIRLPESETCLAHGRFENVRELPAQARRTTMAEFVEMVEADCGPNAHINLGRRFFQSIRCRSCGTEIALNRPAHRIFDDELMCAACRRGRAVVDASARADGAGDYVRAATWFSRKSFGDAPLTAEDGARTLWEAGIPPLHIVSATDAAGVSHAYELTGDLAETLPGWPT